MKPATGLTLVAIGAIFAFAINGHPSWINLHIVGWVIMLTGIIGMVITRAGYIQLPRLRLPRLRLPRRPPQPQPQPPGGSHQAAITGTVVSKEPGPGSEAPPAAGQAPPTSASAQEAAEESFEE
jgi:hypothetical protein